MVDTSGRELSYVARLFGGVWLCCFRSARPNPTILILILISTPFFHQQQLAISSLNRTLQFVTSPPTMRFGRTLQNTIYPPWKEQYIDYDKLKKLLRESKSDAGSSAGSQEDEDEWTEDDESAFVEELVNVQLEKVHAFQAQTLQRLQDETKSCEKQLEPLGVGTQDSQRDKASGREASEESKEEGKEEGKQDHSSQERMKILRDVLLELDSITKEMNELERYSRINYSGFLKACKKHDRKRGHSYRVRPLMQVRLAALPFYMEDYSPMLYRLSAMYSFVRQNLDGKTHKGLSFSGDEVGNDTYTSFKCQFSLPRVRLSTS